MNAVVPALLLAGWAAFAALALPRALLRAAWPSRAPRLGIVVWQAANASALGALALSLLVLAVPVHPVDGSLLRFVRSCLDPSQPGAAPGEALTRLVAATALAVLLGRSLWVAVALGCRRMREVRRQSEAVHLLAGRDRRLGVRLVESEDAAAFCLPGAAGVVLTTAALSRLPADELRAVLAHERAHLAHRHHLVVLVAEMSAAALPRVPVAVVGAAQVRRLVELAVDDAAVRGGDRLSLVEALLAIAHKDAPAGALAAAAGGVRERVLRLAAEPAPLGVLRATAAAAALAAAALVPLAAVVVPTALLSVACSMV